MQAVVLVGGEGTRLRPLTLTKPKPALRLVDRPFIRYACDWLGRHGVDEVVMACGFRAADLRVALGDEAAGMRISYLEEPEPLGTAGPVRLALDRGLLGDRFLVINGDLLADLDLSALQRAHADRDAGATIAVHPVDDPAPYGLVRRGGDGAVTEFVEKPSPSQIDTDEVNAGAYVLEREVAQRIPAGRAVSIEREIFPSLVGEDLFAVRLAGYWLDIGVPERFLDASWDILEGRVRTEPGERARGGVLLDPEAGCEGAIEAPAAVLAGASVEAGAVAGPGAVVGPGTMLRAGARVTFTLLGSGCEVGAGARMEGAILGDGVEVGEGARIASGAVVGDRAKIGANAVLAAESRVGPEETVTA